MNRLLPHYFKYIGLTLFLVSSLPSFMIGFYKGFTGLEASFKGWFVNSGMDWLADIGALIGVLLYFFAKDKLHDELYAKLRMEAINTTLVFSVLAITILDLFLPDFGFSAIDLIYVQLISFLIIRFILKKWRLRDIPA